MNIIRILLALELLSLSVLCFHQEERVTMHSILGGIHLFACLVIIITLFAKYYNTFLLLPIAAVALLTMVVSVLYVSLAYLAVIITIAGLTYIETTHVHDQQ